MVRRADDPGERRDGRGDAAHREAPDWADGPVPEYYEFFEKSVLIGVPDFIPASATDGDVKRYAAFGLAAVAAERAEGQNRLCDLRA